MAPFSFATFAQEKTQTEQEYEREELGVNPYTAPSIGRIFHDLDELKPLPFEQLKRDLTVPFHTTREQLGLAFGSLIADGFLIVESQKKDLVDDLGRSLLKAAQSLGVAGRVIRHSKSLTELGQRGDWEAVRSELIATQGDVEDAMEKLRDQKMAHLISLGGWLRGLEITSGAVLVDYSETRAKIVWQRELVNYFDQELKTLPPELSQSALFVKLRTGIDSLRLEFNRALPESPSRERLKSVHDQARELNLAIQRQSQ